VLWMHHPRLEKHLLKVRVNATTEIAFR